VGEEKVFSSGFFALSLEPGGGVFEAVYSEVAFLAGCYDVVGVDARWGALAEVGDGEADRSAGPVCGEVVSLAAAVPVVLVALADAFALAARSFEADLS